MRGIFQDLKQEHLVVAFQADRLVRFRAFDQEIKDGA